MVDCACDPNTRKTETVDLGGLLVNQCVSAHTHRQTHRHTCTKFYFIMDCFYKIKIMEVADIQRPLEDQSIPMDRQ